MTPLVKEMVRHSPDPESFMWFDAGHLDWTPHVRVPIDTIMHLPFPRTAICAVDKTNVKLAMCLIGGENSVTVAGFRLDPFNLFRPFAYLLTPEGMRYYIGKEECTAEFIKPAFRMVVAGLLRINDGGVAHQPKPIDSFINRKRIAKGKQPLFDWHTVVIEPPKAKSEPLGGTHASPRLHDRRGHWRTLPSKKKVWVKSCKVGNASNGVVFKDYVIND